MKLAKTIPIEHCKFKTLPLPELKFENRLKRKVSSNIVEVVNDDSPIVNNNSSPIKNPKVGKLKKYAVFTNDCLNETTESKSTGEKNDYPNKFDLTR